MLFPFCAGVPPLSHYGPAGEFSVSPRHEVRSHLQPVFSVDQGVLWSRWPATAVSKTDNDGQSSTPVEGRLWRHDRTDKLSVLYVNHYCTFVIYCVGFTKLYQHSWYFRLCCSRYTTNATVWTRKWYMN